MLKFSVDLIITNLLIFIVFKHKCQVLGQNGVRCRLEDLAKIPNICDSPHLIHVGELTSCGGRANVCWCIIIDNRGGQYDGTMVVELSQEFYPGDFQPLKSYQAFTVINDVNNFVYKSSSDARNEITSVKIRGDEICNVNNFINATPKPASEVEIFGPPTITNSKLYDDSNLQNILYEDCVQKKANTRSIEKYCPNVGPQFLIEKRFLYNNVYWCININNDNFIFTPSNRLQIMYSQHKSHVNWAPEDAHTGGQFFGSEFHLGNQRTIIFLWAANNEQLSNVNSITIDRRPICNYFDQPQISIRFNSTESSQPIRPITIDQNCGIKKNVLNPLIANGHHTRPGEWPWHAAIYIRESRASSPFACGGTLIDRKTIITAAHCVHELNSVVIPNRFIVELGRYDLTLRSDWTKEYRVFDVIPHEGYDFDTFQNDIAILLLANYVDLTSGYVNFICLPNQNAQIANQLGTVAGWGLDENNNMLTKLETVTLPVVDQIQCLTSNRGFFHRFLSNTNFCAGYMNKTNVCRGDSGGGLVFYLNNKWILGGITSFGVQSMTTDHPCDLNQYVIFTDVTKFIPWIKRKMAS